MKNNRLLCALTSAFLSAALLTGCFEPEAPQPRTHAAPVPATAAEQASPEEYPVPEESSPEQSSAPAETAVTEKAPEAALPAQSSAEKLLSEMTAEEKVGQLFIIRPEALYEDFVDEAVSDNTGSSVKLTSDMAEMLGRYSPGGIILFSHNIDSPKQLKSFLSDFQENSRIPLFTAVDEEGGQVTRIAGNDNFDVPQFDSARSIGDTEDSQQAFEYGQTIGEYLTAYGFNLDFAPVADVNTNPDNIVIGDRAFGSDPVLCAEMVSAAADGLHDGGVMTVLKHFPGHGDTYDDTHYGYAESLKSWEEMKYCELIPFVSSFEHTDMIMSAHITCPNVTDDGLPASLSYDIITEKLRNELGYDGVVITDALAMEAVSYNYSSAEACIQAINAGADILLLPKNFEEAYNGVLSAVNNGEISSQRLDESVMRILKLKEKYGLI